MLYASYEEEIKTALGINDYFQARERDDLDMSEIVERVRVKLG